uniref:Uncharacterized protein n=1 Tax=Setaria digitata TaxID=48799 RepID=A0A915PNA6_9BILA
MSWWVDLGLCRCLLNAKVAVGCCTGFVKLISGGGSRIDISVDVDGDDGGYPQMNTGLVSRVKEPSRRNVGNDIESYIVSLRVISIHIRKVEQVSLIYDE